MGKEYTRQMQLKLEQLKQRQLLALKYENYETMDYYALQIQNCEEEMKLNKEENEND